VESGLLLDVVVLERAAVFELLTRKDEALLVWGNALLVLDLGLDVLDGVALLDVKGDRLAGESLHKDLHATAQTENKVEGRLLLDVVVLEGAAILKLLASEDEALLIRGDALLVLDLGLNVLNGVGLLHIKGDSLSSERLDEDLHATAEAEDQVKSGLLLDVVVLQSAAVLKLLASEDEALLVWRDALLILDFGLDVLNRVRLFDVQGNSLARKSLDENLHF